MIIKRLRYIYDEYDTFLKEDRLFKIRVADSPVDAWMVVDGRRVLNFCTNNYLGLANHPDLKAAAKKAVDDWGVGPGAVRIIAGTQSLHKKLEQKLAEFKKVEAALFVQSGFCANQAVIPALIGREDVIFSDRLNHASIIDGARLSRAKIIVFDHCDVNDLQLKIEENLPNFRRGLMVTDGVFSMDGDFAPLDKLYEVSEKHGVLTMVDDAHGEGVLGQGRGIVHHFGLQGKIDVEVGTLSKAFGVVGGVIAGKKVIVDYITQKARPYIFSSASTPADTAACLAAVEILQKSSYLVEKLWANAEYIKKGLTEVGFDTGFTQTPIVPLMIGEADRAKEFASRLFQEGVFAVALCFPVVPKGTARIRLMNTAAHSRNDLDFGLSIFEKVGRELGVI